MPVYKNTNKSTKDGKCYYFTISYKDNEGNYKKYNSKMFATKKEAQQEERNYLTKYGKKEISHITFNDIIEEYLKSKKDLRPQSYKRLQTTLVHIGDSLGKIAIEKMTKVNYESFRDSLDKKGFTPQYKNKICSLCKTLIKYAFKMYGIRNDIPDKFEPYRLNENKKEMDFYTYDEFQQFISVVDKVEDNEYYCLFNLLFWCGLRIGEANALTFEDIDFDKCRLNINKSVSTKIRDEKGNYLIGLPKTQTSIRNIPVPKHIIDMLQDRYKRYKNKKYFVFGLEKPLAESTIRKKKSLYAKLSGVKEIRLHDFRHSCASLYLNVLTSDVLFVKSLLGHSSLEETLDTYSHFYHQREDDVMIKANEMYKNNHL